MVVGSFADLPVVVTYSRVCLLIASDKSMWSLVVAYEPGGTNVSHWQFMNNLEWW